MGFLEPVDPLRLPADSFLLGKFNYRSAVAAKLRYHEKHGWVALGRSGELVRWDREARKRSSTYVHVECQLGAKEEQLRKKATIIFACVAGGKGKVASHIYSAKAAATQATLSFPYRLSSLPSFLPRIYMTNPLNSLSLTLPTNPFPSNNPPNPNLTTLQVSQAERLKTHLRLLTPLLPGPNLLPRTIPLSNNSNMPSS